MLPPLHRLPAGQCQPCGKAFKTWGTALKYPKVKNHKNTKGKLDSETECAICQAPLRKKAELGDLTVNVEVLLENNKCGHAFHLTCLKGFVKGGGRNCPICRTPITTRVLRRLGDDDTLEEGEMQRLGQYDRDPESANFYAPNPGDRARANNPENDDESEPGDDESEPGDDESDPDDDGLDGLSEPQLREMLSSWFPVGEDEDVYELKEIFRAVRDDPINIRIYLGRSDFKRWAIFALKQFSASFSGAANMMVILGDIYSNPGGNSTRQYFKDCVDAAIAITNRQSSPDFPEASLSILNWLRRVASEEFLYHVRAAITAENMRRGRA